MSWAIDRGSYLFLGLLLGLETRSDLSDDAEHHKCKTYPEEECDFCAGLSGLDELGVCHNGNTCNHICPARNFVHIGL